MREKKKTEKGKSSVKKKDPVRKRKDPLQKAVVSLISSEDILKSFTDPVMIINRDEIVIFANDLAFESLGFDPKGWERKKILKRIQSRTFSGRNSELSNLASTHALEGKTLTNIEHCFINAKGEKRITLSSAAPIIKQGQVKGTIVTWHDITHRKKMEKELDKYRELLENALQDKSRKLADTSTKLKEQLSIQKETKEELEEKEAVLEKIFASMHFLIAFMDNRFRFVRVNEAYARMSGKETAHFQGKDHFELFPNEENKRIFQRVVDTGVPYTAYAKSFEYEEIPEKGTTYWDWSLEPIKDEQGDCEALILILIDVTKRIEAEKENRRIYRELNETKRLADLGKLAATIAHELRNPLGVIRTAAFNIKRKVGDERIAGQLKNIEKKVQESNYTITNLLAYTRLKQPQYQKIELYPFINECIKNVTSFFSNYKVTVKKELKSIKNTNLSIDPHQIKEVMTNLLNNAYQSFPDKEGGIILAADIGKHFLTVSVSDNGIGISDKDVERIFDPFFTSRSKGTGLGLSLCKEFVELHGGRISVSSREGKGTTMMFELPLRKYHNE